GALAERSPATRSARARCAKWPAILRIRSFLPRDRKNSLPVARENPTETRAGGRRHDRGTRVLGSLSSLGPAHLLLGGVQRRGDGAARAGGRPRRAGACGPARAIGASRSRRVEWTRRTGAGGTRRSAGAVRACG